MRTRTRPTHPDSLAGVCSLARVCLALPVVVWLVVAGCRPPVEAAPEIELLWSVRPEPPRTGPTLVVLTLTDRTTAEPVEGAQVRLEGTMSHPGMQPVLEDARETASGRYEASIDLSMAGDWILLAEAVLPDGRTLQRQKDLPGVQTGETGI